MNRFQRVQYEICTVSETREKLDPDDGDCGADGEVEDLNRVRDGVGTGDGLTSILRSSIVHAALHNVTTATHSHDGSRLQPQTDDLCL